MRRGPLYLCLIDSANDLHGPFHAQAAYIEEHLVDRTRDPHIGKEEGFAEIPRNLPVERSAEERVKDFDLISAGLTCQQAECESGRCLQCDLRGDLTRVRMWTEYSVK